MALQSPEKLEVNYACPTVLSDNQGAADLLAVGFGTTVAMWAIGYWSRLPGVQAAPQLVFPLLLICLVVGGFVAGRYSHRGWRAGLYAALIASLLNLLILGSLLTQDQSADSKHTAAFWLPAFFAIAAALGAAGGLAGKYSRRGTARGSPPNWKAAFAWVAVAATGLLLTAGGLVTGFNAGLAVPDWPSSLQTNMFLLPLSRMTGGIYFEHAHRLLGALVGFTTLTFAIYLLRAEARRWVTAIVWTAGCFVAVQAILGGLRVVDKSRELAVLHGVLAQFILGTFVAVAIFCSRRFASRTLATARPGAGMDHLLSEVLVGALMFQLVLGALVRHQNKLVLLHIMMATVVALLVLIVGMRAAALNEQIPLLRRLGLTLLVLVCVQIIAGVNALVFGGYGDMPPGQGPQPTLGQALASTVHQINGALLLACAVAIMVWSRRLLTEPARPNPSHQAATPAPQTTG